MLAIDDRHAIRNPFGSAQDMEVFEKTLLKTRIPDLFRTRAGLEGHVQQIQQELNRLGKVEGRSGEEVDRAIRVSRCLRAALLESKEEAKRNEFPFHDHWRDFYTLVVA